MRRRIRLLKPTPSPSTANATPAMTDNTILPFSFPAVHAKKITAAFDGGRLTSNGGVMLLAMAERRLGLADKLARVFPDRRDPTRVVHSLVDMFRARMFAICCGYEDADDLDHLRSDPAFKLACGRLPDTGRDLCSQPTLSRLENAPRLRDVIRLTYTLVDAWMDSYPHEPASVTLDIDDTCDVERDGCRLVRVAIHPCVDQSVGQSDHVAQARSILQPRQRRLRTQIATGVRQPSAGQLECRIGPQMIEVIGVLVAAADREHASAEHIDKAMHHPRRIAPIREHPGQLVGQTETPLG